MATLLQATEESHLLFLRLSNCGFQTLEFIKDRIAQILTCKPPRTSRDDELFPFAFQDVIATIGNKCHPRKNHWLSPKKDSEYGGDPQLVFCVLDAMLKRSLERLKLMRESISWAHIGLDGCTLSANYTQHVAAIRNLSLEGKLGVAQWLRNKMIREGVVPDVATHNYLVNGFCKFGALEKAELLVREMELWGPAPSCATYNALVTGYCAFNNVEKALDILSTMISGKVKPNIITYNILVHALCKKGLAEGARNLGQLLNENSEMDTSSVVTSTILMDNYFKNGDTSQALNLWGKICQRSEEMDVVAYNVIIQGFCLERDITRAYKYVNLMFKSGLLPDDFTYNTLMSALCKVGRIDDACYLFTVMSRMGVAPDQISYKILIQGLCMIGDVVTAHELLKRMLENSMVPQPFIWNVIIDCYGKHGDKRRALAVSSQMMSHRVSPNVFTYNALICMLIKDGEIAAAHALMTRMLLIGPTPDLVTYNLLVGAESSFGRPNYAEDLVNNEMLKRGCVGDIVTYTELIKGYCRRGKTKEAERILERLIIMSQSNILVIDHVPFQILMKSYWKMGDLDRAYLVYQKWLRSRRE